LAARSAIIRVCSRSKPWANLKEASVSNPKLREARRTDLGLKLADSNTIIVVCEVISARCPPLMPAIANIPSSSAIVNIWGLRIYFLPPKVSIDSLVFAGRIIIFSFYL